METTMADHPAPAPHLPTHARQSERLAQRGWRALDRAMQRPCTYRHPAGRIRRIETHLSVVYLAGRYAYKLKKRVNPGFVDFTRADARERACAAEFGLNQRFARELYCGVAMIARRGRVYRIGGTGRMTEHAVRMRRFDGQESLSALHARGELGFAEIDALAGQLASFHRRAPRTPPGVTAKASVSQAISMRAARAALYANAMATCTWITSCAAVSACSCSIASNSTPGCAGSISPAT
jgi:aminoglycoside phosphotransferase family enzyme